MSIAEITRLLKVLRLLEDKMISPTSQTISIHFGREFHEDILTYAVEIRAIVEEIQFQQFSYEHR